MPRPRKYPPELLDRGARLVFESGRPVAHVARDLGVPSETLRKYVRRVDADEGLRPDLPTAAEREEIKALRKEVYELRRANEILKAASVFCDRARRRPSEVSRFSDEHRGRFGVEPICRALGVSATAYYHRKIGQRSRRATESGCSSRSSASTARTTKPTATGAPGRRSGATASGSAATESSG